MTEKPAQDSMSGLFCIRLRHPTVIHSVGQSAVRLCYYHFRGKELLSMPRAQTSKDAASPARLDVRLNAQAKEKIEQAAVACHQTVTDFVVTALLRASEDALARRHTIHLTDRDRDLFLAS